MCGTILDDAPATVTASRSPRRSFAELFFLGDWGPAIRLAFVGAGIGLLIIAGIVLIAGITLFISSATAFSGFSDISSGASSTGTTSVATAFKTFAYLIPALWAAAQGAAGIDPITITGIGWIVVSFVVAVRIGRSRDLPRTADGILSVAVKSAFVYGLLAVGVVLLLRTALSDLLSSEVSSAMALPGVWASIDGFLNPFGAWIGATCVGLLGVGFALFRNARVSIMETLGLHRPSKAIAASWAGARQAASFGVVAALIAIVAGAALLIVDTQLNVHSASDPFGLARFFTAALAPLLAASLLYMGVDLAIAANAFAMRFFAVPGQFGSFVHVPGWVYLGLLIPVLACLRGGIEAAKTSDAPDRIAATRAGASIAMFIGPMVLGVSLLYVTRVGAGLVVATGILAFVWSGIVGAFGGLIHGRQAALPDRIEPIRPRPPRAPRARPVPPLLTEVSPVGHEPVVVAPASAATPQHVVRAGDCSRCGAENPASSKFCGGCGADLTSRTKSCGRCGQEHPADVRFCRNCGSGLE